MVRFLPETLVHILGLPITNTLLTTWLAALIVIAVSLLAVRRMKMVPGTLQNMFELFIETAHSFVQDTIHQKKVTELVFPLVTTIFIYILFTNWLGLFPGIGSIGFWETHGGERELVHFFRPGNTDINMTLGLAIVSVLAAQILGIATLGMLRYGSKFINFTNPIKFFVGILELISEMAKLISFSFRLFGNMFAGEVLLIVAAFFLPFILPLPFMMLELFVGLIQALVFAMLTLVFLKTATEEAH
ncbi:MAG: ATP synthase F0 subunit A [Parcubacteria group bacterium RIFCSPHIGHO2_01_FULL_47_10b]|nr:MAG: ATP synthase F0 subunit A [Parcubacteria group bacterium RIFCSPHIGHO2_01_FULL_47_10b]